MFMPYRMLVSLFILFSMQLSASPLTTQLIDIPNMRQSECLKQGQAALQALQFLDIKTVDNTTVFAQDPPYYAAILCHAEKETVYVTVSGKQTAKNRQFMQQINNHFSQIVTQSNLCSLTPKSWDVCDDKTVKLRGYIPAPHQILPAPMLNFPLMPNMQQTDAPQASIQSYMNVGEQQVILLSSQTIPCLTGLEVIGRLDSVALGGAARTPNSYKGWSLYVDSIKCLQ
ncbi:hypothetical protein [Candidatus Albibeggiatoa sp. nov. BB20]|uniref:hypothetical protein n=1 Tax=Candidatus Albibeggiatoa sp. nov. BB20 TaxID=3162723 RepID=UPI00336593BA